MKKNRWLGVSKEARRSYILARHKLTFEQWCTVVQTRINMAKSRLEKKIFSSNVPKKLKGLPVIPEQAPKTLKTADFFSRFIVWLKEFFTPAKALPTVK